MCRCGSIPPHIPWRPWRFNKTTLQFPVERKKRARSPRGRPGRKQLFCFEGRLQLKNPKVLQASKRALRSRWWRLRRDTRRWSTEFTTQLAYITMVQQTTSFRIGYRRLEFLPEESERPGQPVAPAFGATYNCIINAGAGNKASSIWRECWKFSALHRNNDAAGRTLVRA